MLLRSPARYVGVLGPRRRTDRMLAELQAGGQLPDLALARLHAPVGLEIGAETPDEIALAILAEVQADLTATSGRQLRARQAPIHAPGPPAGPARAAAE